MKPILKIVVLSGALFLCQFGVAQAQVGYRIPRTTSTFGNYGPYVTRPYYTPLGVYRPIQNYGISSTPLYNPTYMPSTSFYSPARYNAALQGFYGPYRYRREIDNFNEPYVGSVYPYRYGSLPTSSAPAQSTTGAGGNNSAITKIQIKVPSPETQLWIGGAKMKQTGTLRTFETPPLKYGETYQYRIRTVWTENGVARDGSRTVRLKAGQQLNLDLTK